MQCIAGVSDLEQLRGVSAGRFGNYSDDGTRLHGAYGPRTAAGLARVVETLSIDHDSRQAVVPVWNGREDLHSKDVPCTLSWSFRLRANRLNMTTVMRSNDVWRGLAYDIPAMVRLQSAVAWALGARMGTYVHHAQSLHLYEADATSIGDLGRPTASAP